MNDFNASIAVFRARIKVEGLELDDGQLLVAPVPDAPFSYVVARKIGNLIEPVARYDNEAEAIEACEQFIAAARQLERPN
jgi:hypothetical protein